MNMLQRIDDKVFPKFSKSKLQRRVADWLDLDRRRFEINYVQDGTQARPWTGWTEYGSPAIVTLTYNGEPRSDKTEYGIRIRTWNAYETWLVAHAHEFQHVKHNRQRPNGERLCTKAEARILRKHRRSWFFIPAFFVRA